MSLGVISVKAHNDQREDRDDAGNPELPMIVPVLSKSSARLLAVGVGASIPVLIGMFVWFIYSSLGAIDEHGAVIGAKTGAAFGCLVLTYPLIHALLDLLTFGCVYRDHLL